MVNISWARIVAEGVEPIIQSKGIKLHMQVGNSFRVDCGAFCMLKVDLSTRKIKRGGGVCLYMQVAWRHGTFKLKYVFRPEDPEFNPQNLITAIANTIVAMQTTVEEFETQPETVFDKKLRNVAADVAKKLTRALKIKDYKRFEDKVVDCLDDLRCVEDGMDYYLIFENLRSDAVRSCNDDKIKVSWYY